MSCCHSSTTRALDCCHSLASLNGDRPMDPIACYCANPTYVQCPHVNSSNMTWNQNQNRQHVENGLPDLVTETNHQYSPSMMIVPVRPILRLPNPLELFQAYYQLFYQRRIQVANELVELNWHYLAGSFNVANNILSPPQPTGDADSAIRVNHQLRLAQSLMPLWQKIQNPGEYCIFVGLPTCFQSFPACYTVQRNNLARVSHYLRSNHIAALYQRIQDGVFYYGHFLAPTSIAQRIIHDYDPNLSFFLRGQPYLVIILTGTTSSDVNYLTSDYQYKSTEIPNNVNLSDF